MDYIFAGSVPSDIHCAKEFINVASQALSKIVSDEEQSFDIRLILQELLMNGVIHGNCMDRNKYVSLGINYQWGNLKIIVQDEGKGVYPKKEKCEDDMQCNGRGLQIVEALSDQVLLKGNEVIVVKSL